MDFDPVIVLILSAIIGLLGYAYTLYRHHVGSSAPSSHIADLLTADLDLEIYSIELPEKKAFDSFRAKEIDPFIDDEGKPNEAAKEAAKEAHKLEEEEKAEAEKRKTEAAADEAAKPQHKKKPPPPGAPVRLADANKYSQGLLMRRAMAIIGRAVRVNEEAPKLQRLQQSGLFPKDLLDKIQLGVKTIEGEFAEIKVVASKLQPGWGNVIFQQAADLKMKLQQQAALQSKKQQAAATPPGGAIVTSSTASASSSAISSSSTSAAAKTKTATPTKPGDDKDLVEKQKEADRNMKELLEEEDAAKAKAPKK